MNENLEILENGRSHIRAAIYLHAKPKANGNSSIRRQLEQCRKFAKRNGWVVTDLFLEKERNQIVYLLRSRAAFRCFDTILSFVRLSDQSLSKHPRKPSINAICDARLWSDIS